MADLLGSLGPSVRPREAEPSLPGRSIWLWVPAFAGTNGGWLSIQLARRLRLVVAERVERVGAMQEAIDRRAGDDCRGRRQEHGLPHLLVPAPHTHRKALVAIEAGIAEDERPLLVELGRARAQRRLHHHLHGDPGRPVGALHTPSAARPIETRVDLRPPIAFPGPVPADRLEIDRTHHRPRLHSLKRHLAGKLESVVGDEDHVIVAGTGGEQQRIVQIALARISADLEGAVGYDAGAELLDGVLERLHG